MYNWTHYSSFCSHCRLLQLSANATTIARTKANNYFPDPQDIHAPNSINEHQLLQAHNQPFTDQPPVPPPICHKLMTCEAIIVIQTATIEHVFPFCRGAKVNCAHKSRPAIFTPSKNDRRGTPRNQLEDTRGLPRRVKDFTRQLPINNSSSWEVRRRLEPTATPFSKASFDKHPSARVPSLSHSLRFLRARFTYAASGESPKDVSSCSTAKKEPQRPCRRPTRQQRNYESSCRMLLTPFLSPSVHVHVRAHTYICVRNI